MNYLHRLAGLIMAHKYRLNRLNIDCLSIGFAITSPIPEALQYVRVNLSRLAVNPMMALADYFRASSILLTVFAKIWPDKFGSPRSVMIIAQVWFSAFLWHPKQFVKHHKNSQVLSHRTLESLKPSDSLQPIKFYCFYHDFYQGILILLYKSQNILKIGKIVFSTWLFNAIHIILWQQKI